MSCHDIGRGMNTVGDVILEKYDEGCFDLPTAKDLLRATILGVNWCDGNEYEAVESYENCRCGNCLKAISQLVDVDSLVCNRSERKYCYSFACKHDFKLVITGKLCKECTKKLFDVINEELDRKFSNVEGLFEYIEGEK